MFVSCQFIDISISEIAQKAGVARLTFYRNYDSKEDIIIRKTRIIYNELMIDFEKIVLGNRMAEGMDGNFKKLIIVDAVCTIPKGAITKIVKLEEVIKK